MGTKTKPMRQVTVSRSTIDLSTHDQVMLGLLLGFPPSDRGSVLAKLCDQLSENQVSLRGAPLSPTRAHHIAAFANVQRDAERLYRTIADLPEHHRSHLPDVEVFMSQVAKFHDDVQIGLIQMRGRGSTRGGGKKMAISGARSVAEHSIRIFFDLNARGRDGGLRTNEAKTSDQDFLTSRQHFVDYCMGLIDPSSA